MAEPDPDALLREADHRSKNTLQLISSLVLLQGRRAGEPAVKAALKALQQRITAVSLAHRHVTREAGAEVVELAALIRELASEMAQSAGRKDLVLELDLTPLTAPARIAAPLALIANEAIANALTHAFPPSRSGHIRVALESEAAGFRLTVQDDGEGADGAAAGFGRTILQLMTQQLRGRLESDAAQPGHRVAVWVPMNPEARG